MTLGPLCPRCHQSVTGQTGRCPACGASLEPEAGQNPQGELFEMVDIYKIPDEITGLAIRSFLADHGIDAVLQDMQASFYAGTLNMFLGYWGKLLVPKEQEEQARGLLEDFLRDFQGR